MASVEFLEKRIAGKTAELEKLRKKMDRILKAKESNYEDNNPYMYSDYDFRSCTKDLESAEKALAKYQTDLKVAVEKDNSRNVKAILDFLDNWKDTVYDYYVNSEFGLAAYYKERAELKKMWATLNSMQYYSEEWKNYKDEVDAYKKSFNDKCRGYHQDLSKDDPRYRRWNTSVKVRNGEYEWLNEYTSRANSLDECEQLLKKTLDEEAKRKYDDIIERTNKYVGQITDASGLRVGAKGDLNGTVEGTSGKARIETIGAGGYNIQAFHFRTLIHPVKEAD